jgi:hypothetical protein
VIVVLADLDLSVTEVAVTVAVLWEAIVGGAV